MKSNHTASREGMPAKLKKLLGNKLMKSCRYAETTRLFKSLIEPGTFFPHLTQVCYEKLANEYR